MDTYTIPFSDPDMSEAEIAAVGEVLASPRLSQGPVVEDFETAFAGWLGRKHAVAVASGTMGLLLTFKAHGIGPGDEVVVTPYSWHQVAQAVALAGATPVFTDIDYWSGAAVPEKVEAAVGANTRALLAGNTNGHPAPWRELREVAQRHGLVLLEDSTESIGSTYEERTTGTFGDCAVFDFSQPGALVCGEGGMAVTDNDDIAAGLRQWRNRRLDERTSIVAGTYTPYQAGISDLTAAIGLTQLSRLDGILERRRETEQYYYKYLKSFEGIKDPYVAPDVTAVHWFVYTVHLGTRFSRSSRDAIVDDLRGAGVEAYAYCQPLHRQRFYLDQAPAEKKLFVTEKVADRAIALPFHAHLTEDQIAFIVTTMKDSSVNVGAGAAIYL
jgi:perosamine synthetase